MSLRDKLDKRTDAPLLILIFSQNYPYRNCYVGRCTVVMENVLITSIIFIFQNALLRNFQNTKYNAYFINLFWKKEIPNELLLYKEKDFSRRMTLVFALFSV